MGKWNGIQTVGDEAVLSYRVRGVDIREHPSSVREKGAVGITRTFEVGARDTALTLVAAEVRKATGVEVGSESALVSLGTETDSVTAVGGVNLPPEAVFRVVDDRYVTLQLPEGDQLEPFRLVHWTGPRDQLPLFQKMTTGPVAMPDAEDGREQWTRSVRTRGRTAPDTSAFVVDELSLPLPNPWKRNVRVADIDFFRDGRAAVVTFSGDVWIVSGIDDDLAALRWERFASGLFEPLSLSIVDGAVYVYGREGIVRLRDRNADGEADFYENYTRRIVQSMETREWPLDMIPRPGGGFYATMGAALNAGPQTGMSEEAVPGFRVGSKHAGTVVEVLPGGDSVRVYADGFREPYLGAHPKGDFVTASDQQGNFVPSTPIYVVEEGEYYGVPASTRRSAPLPEPPSPLTWIPHQADPSGTSQLWVDSDEMGPLNGKLLHFSYSRPGPFRVYADTTEQPWQGGVTPLPGEYETPTVKGAVHPSDGQVYVGGFQVWGTRAEKNSSLIRLRHTGQPSKQPTRLRAGTQGIVLRFDQRLDSLAASSPQNYTVSRWQYQRTEEYGSGRYKLDGSPGEEQLPVAAVHLSDDRRAVFLVVPDMRTTMQLQIDYTIKTPEGTPLNGPVYATLNESREIDLGNEGFEGTNWQEDLQQAGDLQAQARRSEAEQLVSARRGRHLHQEIGCTTCHSIDGSSQVGPSFKGLYGKTQAMKSGDQVVADAEYIRESILHPSKHVVEGYPANMPSYEGILSESELASLVAFIRSLDAEPAE
jgi:cytochrome c2